ncbi:MAG: hypothetical protein RL527_1127, partial [Planctomycetota bacterium]
ELASEQLDEGQGSRGSPHVTSLPGASKRFSISSCLVVGGLCAQASAGFLSSAVIDDFSGSAGLGYNRSETNGAFIGGGEGFLSGGAGFQYLLSSDQVNESLYNGFSLKVSGSLGSGGLFISVVGEGLNFVALDVDFGSSIVDGYAWITYEQLDAAVGNDIGLIRATLNDGGSFAGIGIYTTGDAQISVDDFEFRGSAVPAPGAIALAAAAGLAASRRRR